MKTEKLASLEKLRIFKLHYGSYVVYFRHPQQPTKHDGVLYYESTLQFTQHWMWSGNNPKCRLETSGPTLCEGT